MYGNPWFYVALVALFFIGVTKSGFGSGVGLIIVPMTAVAMGHGAFPGRGEEAALGLLLPLLVVGDLISIYQHRGYFKNAQADVAPAERDYSTRRIMKLLLPGTVLGVLIGSLILWWFSRQEKLVANLMRIEIGAESVLLVGLHWWRQWRGMQTTLMPEPGRGVVTGTFAGASSTLAHAAGPIITMYLLPLKLERRLYVAVCALYFFILNSLKMPFYWQAGLFAKAELPFTVMFLPVVLAGAIFGFSVNKRMNDKLFSKIVYVCTFVLGWYILGDGVVGLIRSLE